ncbi:hypothetical protein I5R65_07575 [Herbaspirillum sp. AP02]|uniref:hypothetical protein n=1 Tax=unclassified Herbaspirillum TaxID=2624150 RepID=UPI0015DAC653|nr:MULTISPECIES: hypothetical protein [unclassified Herbaspirillum]MBG7619319.1 hypothetical protein [Herbaspirillum sp. AP02]NZD66603.1 hypothetical protein [Herbaspirillum sp. AP21]
MKQPRAHTNSRELQDAIYQIRVALENIQPEAPVTPEDSKALDDLLPLIARALPGTLNIVITGERAKRFHWTLSDMTDINVSLESSVTMFPDQHSLEPGQIHPAIAVEAFSAGMSKRLDLLLAILANEEKPEVANGR